MLNSKPIIHYTVLTNVVIPGGNASIVPVDHWIQGFNGHRLLVGPVIQVIERVNDARPVFETHSAVYIPKDTGEALSFLVF